MRRKRTERSSALIDRTDWAGDKAPGSEEGQTRESRLTVTGVILLKSVSPVCHYGDMAAFLQLIPLTGVLTNFQFFSVGGTFNLYLGVSTGLSVHLCMCV